MPERWTAGTDREADVFFDTLPEREIRRRQDLAEQQMRRAFQAHQAAVCPAERQRYDEALIDLQAMHDALSRAMGRRLEWPKGQRRTGRPAATEGKP